MIDNSLLQNSDNHVKIVVNYTSDKRLAKQLADYYMALAQAYRKMADIEPVPTGNQMRKIAKCGDVAR